MKKEVKYIIAAIALIVVGVGVKLLFFPKQVIQVIVTTTDVTTGEIITEVTATGTVEPVDQVEVGTQVSGLVDKIYVDYNSGVRKGDLLAELDKTILNESVANAQAAYNSAVSQLTYQQQNYDRQKRMYEAQVISKADYEYAEYQLQAAMATLSQNQTALRQAQTNLGYAYIYSPIDGVILTKEVEEGQTVAASMSTPTLFTIAKDLTKMQVEADVDEADIGNVEVGQRVSFIVDAYPGVEFSGRVKQVRLGATVTSNVVTYTVIVDADNPDQKLKPGLTATIAIYTKELKNIITVPAQAMAFTPDAELLAEYCERYGFDSVSTDNHTSGSTVWLKISSGAIESKAVEIGEKDGVNVQIVSGLNVGDKVITSITKLKVAVSKEKDSESPFMPKPPSRNNKKSTASLSKK